MRTLLRTARAQYRSAMAGRHYDDIALIALLLGHAVGATALGVGSKTARPLGYAREAMWLAIGR